MKNAECRLNVAASWQSAAILPKISQRRFAKRRYAGLAMLAFCLLIPAFCLRASGQNYSIDWHKIAGGGYQNYIETNSDAATIAGGYQNQAAEEYAALGGGYRNQANGTCAAVPGGQNHVASGFCSFAAGYGARANYAGSFVWTDNTSIGGFGDSGPNQVCFRCTGGVYFAGGYPGNWHSVYWTPESGFWNFSSDRDLKEGFALVEGKAVLEKVARLPLSEWNYRGCSERHIGPMAQDFHAAFPLNDSDTTLNDADLHGVALAEIQGVNEILKEKDIEIQELRKSVSELKVLVNSLVQKSNGGGQ